MTVPVVVGTGLIALDVVLRGSENAPVRQCAGGTCGNVLTVLAYLGWKSIPVARHAADRASAIVRDDLEHWRVDTRFIDLEPKRPTPIVIQRILHGEDGEPIHRFSWTCPCCGAWLPRYQPVGARAAEPVLRDVQSPTVFFFDRPSRGAIELAHRYSATGTLIVFEPSALGDRAHFGGALEAADIVKYSDQRLAALPTHRPSVPRRLEVQTLGARGLRFRIGAGRRSGAWRNLPAMAAGRVADTAGAGDWCTAGLLQKLARGGRSSFGAADDDEVLEAVRYGQALSAWNCRFEGARGGMYERSRSEFTKDVTSLLGGKRIGPAEATPEHDSTRLLGEICPSCPAGHSLAPPKVARQAIASPRA